MDGEREKFDQNLREFQQANQICLCRDASLCDEPADMFLIFNIVKSRGGFANVTRERKWAVVAYECCGIEKNKNASSRLTSASLPLITTQTVRFQMFMPSQHTSMSL